MPVLLIFPIQQMQYIIYSIWKMTMVREARFSKCLCRNSAATTVNQIKIQSEKCELNFCMCADTMRSRSALFLYIFASSRCLIPFASDSGHRIKSSFFPFLFLRSERIIAGLYLRIDFKLEVVRAGDPRVLGCLFSKYH